MAQWWTDVGPTLRVRVGMDGLVTSVPSKCIKMIMIMIDHPLCESFRIRRVRRDPDVGMKACALYQGTC